MTKSAPSLEAPADNASSVTLAWGLNQREAAILATILIATAILYMPSLRYGWVWDDKAQTIKAKDLHSLAGIGKSFIHDSWWFRDPKNLPQSAYYRPFQTVWFGLNYLIIGNHPAVWHLEKIVLELIGVIVCFRLAQLLTRNNAIALLTAAIFGLLPANIESVVWCSAIGEPLSAIFEMGAMCCLINREQGKSRGLAFALMLYASALLSHETAVLFWLVIAAYLFLIEGKRVGESLRIAAPFIVLAVLYLGARLGALGITNFAGRPDFVIPTRRAWMGETVSAAHRGRHHYDDAGGAAFLFGNPRRPRNGRSDPRRAVDHRLESDFRRRGRRTSRAWRPSRGGLSGAVPIGDSISSARCGAWSRSRPR